MLDALPDSENRTEHVRLRQRLESILGNPEYLEDAKEDSVSTFKALGLSEEIASSLFEQVHKLMISGIAEQKTLPEIEREVLMHFKTVMIDGKNLVEILDEKLSERARIIYEQLAPHMKSIEGPALDFGAGDLQVTQKLQDDLGLHITGTDIREYRKLGAEKPVPFVTYDGEKLSFANREFEAAVATNVLHHAGETEDGTLSAKDNETAVRELCRVAERKLIVIETVPDPELVAQDKARAMERTFWNDYLYNRLFHSADVPVPGRYETLEGWPARFQKHGWTVVHTEALGYDQPTIRDFHVLYVLQREIEIEKTSEKARSAVLSTL